MSYSFHAVKEAAEHSVLAKYGLEKQAFNVKNLFTAQTVGPRGKGFMNTLRWTGRGIREIGREMVFGSPVNLAADLKSHIQTSRSVPKGLFDYWRKNYWMSPRTKGDMALQGLNLASHGYNAYQAYKTEDPDERRRALARLGVGIVTLPFTSRLGIPGALADQALQSNVENALFGPSKS
jgi:hypothetical protein